MQCIKFFQAKLLIVSKQIYKHGNRKVTKIRRKTTHKYIQDDTQSIHR